jgi:formate hydrogenlyase subunit 6/NADH:ubiquinone oxidoreductase subunit I
VEACPFDALYMGRDYERWSYRLEEQTLQKEDLGARQPSGYAHDEIAKDLPPQSLLIDGDIRQDKNKK